jgi:hypothetical protein
VGEQNAFSCFVASVKSSSMAATTIYIMFILYLIADYFNNITNSLKISFYPLFRCAIVMISVMSSTKRYFLIIFFLLFVCQRREMSNSFLFFILQRYSFL